MVVIDTSVWIDFFRGRPLERIQQVFDLLDRDEVALVAPVRIEILSGSSKKQKNSLHRVLSALPIFYPSSHTWQTIEEWIDEGLSRGKRFGAMDLLIAAITAENQSVLWSLDHDFHRMGKLGWVKLFSQNI